MDYKKIAAVLVAAAIIGSASYAMTDTLLFNDVVTVSAAASLRRNSTGSSVTALQNNLISLKYLKSGSATGKYDSATEAAVKKFQTDYNLTADGVAGTKTLNLISGLVNGTAKVLEVKSTLLNVRWTASTDGKLLTTVKSGQRFQIEGEKSDSEGSKWYKITTKYGTGYVCADYVSVSDSSVQRVEAIDASAKKGILKVTGAVLNVRKSASTSSKKLYTVKMGQTYSFTNSKTVNGDKWYYIKVNSKVSGWVLGKWAEPIQTESEVTGVAKSGKLKVVVDILQVRASTSTKSKRLYTTKRDEEYSYSNVKRINNIDWYYIKVNKSVSGWVLGTMVSVIPKESPSTTSATETTKAAQSTTSANPDGGSLTVSVSVLNVRQSANTSSKKVFTAKKDQTYTYSKTKKGDGDTWYYIKVNNSISGWVLGSMVKATPNSTTTEAPETTKATDATTPSDKTGAKSGKLTINATSLNVREFADVGSKRLYSVKKDQTYSYSNVKTVDNVSWYYIKVNNSISGWVMGSYVKATPNSTEAATTTQSTKATEPTVPSVEESGRLRIEATALNVRSDTNTKAKILMTAYQGKVYEYSAVKTVNGEKWYRIAISNSKSGWVNGGFVSILDQPTTTSSTESTKATQTQPTAAAVEKSGKLAIDVALLNVRADTSSQAEILGTVKKDQTYSFSKTKFADNITWYYIKVSDARSGWVMGTYIKVLNESDPAPASGKSGTLTVVGSSVNVRKGAGTNYAKITTVKNGSTYTYSDKKDGWYFIKLSEKQSGWIIGDYVKTNETATTKTTETAKTTEKTTAKTTEGEATKPTESTASTNAKTTESEATKPTETTASTTAQKTTTGVPVSPTAVAAISKTVNMGTVSVNANALIVRKAATTNSAQIGSVKNGAKVVVLSKSGSFYQIEYGTGTGYVSSTCVKDVKSVKQYNPFSYEEDYHYIKPGQSIDLGRSVEGSVVTYTSSDAKKCPVTDKGVASGVKEGLYTITAKCGDKTASVCVVVLKNPNSNIKTHKVSDKGVKFIAEWEGGGTALPNGTKVYYPYKDTSGFWTIGHGHAMTSTASKSWNEKRAIAEFNVIIEQQIGAEYKMTDKKPYISEAAANKLLNADLKKGDYESSVNNWAVRNGVVLNQAQFDALVSFCYNVGSSRWTNDSNKFYLKSAILAHRSGSEADASQIIDGFCRFCKANGSSQSGLWYRRRNEAELFIKGDYSIGKSDKFKLPSDFNK